MSGVFEAALLDASAVLALLLKEPGGEAVEPYVDVGLLSIVNYSEIVARLADRGASGEFVRAQVAALGLTLVDFDEPTAFAAGLLRPHTRDQGLSFADRACLATAAQRGIPVVTADQQWARLQVGIDVKLIR